MSVDQQHSPERAALLEGGTPVRHHRRWSRLLPSGPRCAMSHAPTTSVGGALVRTPVGDVPTAPAAT